MQTRYRLIGRSTRGDRFYYVDKTTGKRTSLETANKDEARQLVEAKNNAERQPILNLQIAKVYLAGSDNRSNVIGFIQLSFQHPVLSRKMYFALVH